MFYFPHSFFILFYSAGPPATSRSQARLSNLWATTANSQFHLFIWGGLLRPLGSISWFLWAFVSKIKQPDIESKLALEDMLTHCLQIHPSEFPNSMSRLCLQHLPSPRDVIISGGVQATGISRGGTAYKKIESCTGSSENYTFHCLLHARLIICVTVSIFLWARRNYGPEDNSLLLVVEILDGNLIREFMHLLPQKRYKLFKGGNTLLILPGPHRHTRSQPSLNHSSHIRTCLTAGL